MPSTTFSITANADDGSGYYQSASWPPSGGTWTNTTGGSGWVSKIVSGDYFNDITLLRFDTSSIPDDATIDSAVLKLYCISKQDVGSYALVGDYYDFGGTPTVAGDWVETASPSIWSALDLGSITTSAVNNITLTDLTGISKTGYTGIRLTLSSGTPVDASLEGSLEFAMLDHATLQEPQLEVTYTVGSSTANVAWFTA